MGVRIVLVDDHLILRDGLRVLLRREADIEVVGETGDARGCMECVRQTSPDLVIVDLQLPDEDGLSCARRILEQSPGTQVLILSGSTDPSRVEEALKAGAAGYVLKDEASDELIRAVRTVMAGKVHLSPAAATALATGFKGGVAAKGPSPAVLSEREREVLRLVSDGLRNKEIAERLSISVKSVETYRARLMAKVGCSSTAELVRHAVREGLIRP